MDWFWNWGANVSGIGTGTACSLTSGGKLADSMVRKFTEARAVNLARS